ncbi:MAG: ASCH domain-containing protein [Caulobacter sp.]
MKVLLSIKPEFVEKIFDGTKCYEYRKVPYKNSDVKTVVVYATRPIAKIVGEFDVEEIISGNPIDIWDLTENKSGITKDFFSEYFEGRKCAFALKIGTLRPYREPIDPAEMFENFTAPQSFRYIDEEENRQPLLI